MSDQVLFKIEKQNPKPDAKTYRISTLQDMMDVVNDDNIDQFLFEFGVVLRSAILTKHINGMVNEENGTDYKVELPYFDWTDD